MEDFYIDYAAMDDIQRSYIDRSIKRSMVVTGSAGSGKSVIALHKLRRICQEGTYAVIVFTKSLKRYFIDGIQDMNSTKRYNQVGANNIYYFQEWQNWQNWNRTNCPACVDYLIVDECQDFTEEQIDMMLNFGKVCYFFGDTDQTIMDFGNKITLKPIKIAAKLHIETNPLYRNYRLTIENAKVIEQIPRPLLDLDVSESCVRHGEKPTLLNAISIDAQLDIVYQIINNNHLSNVGILMRYNTLATARIHSGNPQRSVEYVKNYLENKGMTVEYKYNINKDTEMDLDFRSSNPKIMTWWCAKGLQFKDVFVIDCDYDYINEESDDDKTQEQNQKSMKTVAAAWYVALSRTSERLYIGYSNNLCKRFPETFSSLYRNPARKADSNVDLPF